MGVGFFICDEARQGLGPPARWFGVALFLKRIFTVEI